jgi:sporulation protein YlmC with PRC-barrel domain
MKTSRALTALLFCVLALSGAAEAAAPTQASDLLGMTVTDARNKRLGAVTSLVVDLDKGQITGVQVGHATADGMANDVYPLSAIHMGDGKFVVRAGNAPMSGEAPPTQSVAKILHAPLKDADGKSAGEIEDLLINFEEAKVTAIVIKFDPKWLDMAAAAAVAPSSIAMKDDGWIVKFTASDVRPATPGGTKTAAPPPPPTLLRARLTQLAGSAITDVSGKSLGAVDDVLIDVGARRIAALVIHADGGQPITVTFPQPALRFDNNKFLATAAINTLAPSSAAGLANAQRLLGTRLVNPNDEPAGKLDDVIVDMANGNLKYFVGTFDPSWVAAGWHVTLPMRAITNDKTGAPAMRVSLNEINLAFLFQNWPDFSDQGMAAAVGAKLDR